MARYRVKNPELLKIYDGTKVYFGANQSWYGLEWRKRAGCGPTAASHIFWYLAETRPDLKALAPEKHLTKTTVLSLMDDVWEYVTPGNMGLNNPHAFAKGFESYAASKNISLFARVLDVPAVCRNRPDKRTVCEFIAEGIARDIPVAFLNLSNGSLTNLDGWHWVTLTEINSATGIATMFDQGICVTVDICEWLATTFLGGAFVRFSLDRPTH